MIVIVKLRTVNNLQITKVIPVKQKKKEFFSNIYKREEFLNKASQLDLTPET